MTVVECACTAALAAISICPGFAMCGTDVFSSCLQTMDVSVICGKLKNNLFFLWFCDFCVKPALQDQELLFMNILSIIFMATH